MADKTTTQIAADEQQGSLADFAWDEGTTSFFGQGGDEDFAEETTTEAKQVMKEITTDDDDEEVEDVFKNTSGKPKAPTKKEAQTAKAKAEPEDEDDDEETEFNFGDEEDDEPSEDDDEDEDNQPKDQPKDKKPAKSKEKIQKGNEAASENSFSDLALDLKDRGIFQHAEINEGDEVDGDKLYDLVDQEVEARVDATFEGFFEEMPAEGKALLQHLKAGGSTQDFIRVYGNSSLNIQDFDSKDKKHRQQVIAHYIRSTDDEADAEDIEERIEQLEESGKAEKMAEKYFQRIKAQEEQDKADLAERTRQAEKDRAENSKNFAKYLTSNLEKTDEVKGFKFSAEDKKHLNKLILDPKIKVGKNKYIPEFNFKLGEILKAGTPEATQKLFLLAKLVDSDFDMSDFKVKAKTEVTKEVKSRIKNAKRNVRPSSAGNHNNSKRALSEYVD